MAQTTLTEALARLKTLDKQIERKQQFVREYMLRQDFIKDPLEKEGGSRTQVASARQSIKDLLEQKLKIRSAITKANMSEVVVVEGERRTIADWLVWRREVAPKLKEGLALWRGHINQARQEAGRKQLNLTEKPTQPNDIVVFVSEGELAAEQEQLDKVLGTLDGLLSLKNATTFIDVE